MPVLTEENYRINLTKEPLDHALAMAFVSTPEAGGIASFVGTTRAFDDPVHGQLLALDYAAYPEMAFSEMKRLVSEATQRWPVRRCYISHRLGRVPVGQASVIIAVSCPHRAEAFTACRFLIDELKCTVPIWKQDIYAGDTRWHHEMMEQSRPFP